jgi:hypothetical protein
MTMRIAGKSRLIRAADGVSIETCGAYRAFHAELETARWRSLREVLSAYPDAEREADRLVVPIDGQHCVVVAINYQSGIALIEYAGVRAGRTGKSPTVLRKSS